MAPKAFTNATRSCHQRTKVMGSRWHGVGSTDLRLGPTKLMDDAEDQQRINTFSKLNTRLTDINEQLKAKQVSCAP